MTQIFNSVTELIGKTPIVKLRNVVPVGAADVYVKLEFFNWTHVNKVDRKIAIKN